MYLAIILFLLGLPLAIATIDFLGFLYKGRRIVNRFIIRVIEIAALIVLPYLYVSQENKNDCCGESAVFSPQHQLTIWVIVILCLIAYFYSVYRKQIATPILEVLVNSFLLLGIVFNIFIAIHTGSTLLAIAGNLPIILLAILALVKNQKSFIEQSELTAFVPKNRFEKIALVILQFQPILKFPILFILCLPLLVIITAILLLFGQKTDSLIRAFTDTYKHGFSEWDYQCDNVSCGGHYLCSVAANGHPQIVKPNRRGIRNGHPIICNRQLLIANAFEDLIQEKLPVLHKLIRNQYNKLGNLIHRYYTIFNNRFISDCIYFLMKPLEWFFIVILYSFDRKPENRIAKQYISTIDRIKLDNFK